MSGHPCHKRITTPTTKYIVKATVVLQNLLERDTTAAQTANILDDFQEEAVDGICPLNGVGNRGSVHANKIRDTFKDYFTRVSTVPWMSEEVTLVISK